MNGSYALQYVWHNDIFLQHMGPLYCSIMWPFHNSDPWLEHDAWMSLNYKLPGLEVLFPVCMACFCVMGSIPCKWTAWGFSKSHTAPFMFKCSSPSSVPLIAAWRARGFLQSLHFYFLFPRQMSSIWALAGSMAHPSAASGVETAR